MKRFISGLLVAVMLLSCIATVGFAAETPASALSLTPSKSVVNPGDTITVAINVSGSDFDGFEFELDLTTGLEVVDFEAGTAFGGDAELEGSLIYGFNSKPQAANGLLGTLTVKVADDAAAGTYNIKAVAAIFTTAVDDKQEEFAFSVSNASVTIEGECEHKNTKWDVTTEPTCTKEGVETETCVDCGAVLNTRAIAALGHKPGEAKVTPATCTEAGKSEVFCTVCNELISSEEIAALGHEVADWAHDESHHWHECARCGAKDLDKAPHSYDDSKWVTKEPTTEETGWIKNNCKVCAREYTQTLPKLPNPDDPTPPPTGDISGIVTTSIAALVIVLFSAVAVITKRKAV